MSRRRCSPPPLMDRLRWRSRFVRESERWPQTTRFWDSSPWCVRIYTHCAAHTEEASYTITVLYRLNRSGSLRLLVESHRLKSPLISTLTGSFTSPLKTRAPAENSRVSPDNIYYVCVESLGGICSNSQQYSVWVKIIHFYFTPKIIRY